MNDFFGNILQNKFYACCYILLSGTRPKRRRTPICGAAMLLQVQLMPKLCCCYLHTALNNPNPIHAADGHYTRNSSCITLLWWHHNRKMSISHHKNGLVSSQQSVGRWFYFLCFVVRIFDETGWLSTAYLSLSQDGIRGWNHCAFMWNVFTLVELFSFMWDRYIVYGKLCFVLHVQCCGSCMVSTEYSTKQ